MSLHAAFQKQLQKLPKTAIEQVLSDKLKATGIRSHRVVARKLAEHLYTGSDDPFQWDEGDSQRVIEVEFNEEDIKRLEAVSANAIEAIPDIVARLSKRISSSIADNYISAWKSHRYIQEREWRGFQDRLEDRWGIGLDYIRVLLELSRHLGQAALDRTNLSKARKGRIKNSLLCQLHIRACQISAEIITLLENGFADGALARWRTLHEVSIVALIITDNDDELAKRYIDHDAIEAKAIIYLT